MSARRKVRVEEVEAAEGRGLAFRFVVTTLVLLVILYVVALAISRTAGFRYSVQERVHARLDLPITLEKTWLDLALNLHMKGLRSESIEQEGMPGISFERVEIGWSFLRLLQPGRRAADRIVLKSGTVSLSRDERGRWIPAVLSELGARVAQWAALGVPVGGGEKKQAAPEEPSADRPAKPGASKPSMWRDAHIALEDVNLHWWGPDGQTLAAARGIRLMSSQVRLPNRDMSHYLLSIDRAWTGAGEQLNGLKLELISTDSQNIVLGFSANWSRADRAEPSDDAAPVEKERVRVRTTDAQIVDEEAMTDYIRGALEEAIHSP